MPTSETGRCAICGDDYAHFGNNPEPLGTVRNRVCDPCNSRFVIPARLGMFNAAAVVALNDLCAGDRGYTVDDSPEAVAKFNERYSTGTTIDDLLPNGVPDDPQ